MRSRMLTIVVVLICTACSGPESAEQRSSEQSSSVNIEKYQAFEGYFDLYWDQDGGRLFLGIDALDEPFLYQSSLPNGVGSNDLGLDRGQLGVTRIVRFLRSGPKLLLVQDNMRYRARSDDEDERKAVADSFARSVLWGFDLVGEYGDSAMGSILLVDATDFFVRDVHGLATRLTEAEEGEFRVDPARSVIFLPRTRAFPDNSEIEAVVTFAGQPAGPHLPTVVPDPTSVSVHMHHSFIRLPDDGYEPLPFDPRSGVIGVSDDGNGFLDYATAIGEELRINYGRRHRLEKKNPEAEFSEAVEPIVYYVDRGAPEPVRSALIEGASWWNQAFEAAGYKDAFRVELLPEDADPMDVRYNTIQWVHRSTRGWSYGYSVVDPRTGEILKGHVTLGSLRVRQDYLIVEGLLAPYADDAAGTAVPDTMLDVSLARIRQLSAHEVGHTLGFHHNFAASTQDRASVMDYPVPLVRFDAAGGLDFSEAYGDAIGSWDTRSVLYAYQDFPDGVDRIAARRAIIEQTVADGYRYVSDEDSRAVSSAHPDGNLWDNGDDAIAELEHLLAVRAYALERFSEANVRPGRPLATIEEALVPIYLLHRFQLHAVGKLLGGSYFNYSLRGDGQNAPTPVAADRQIEAMEALLATLHPDVLRLPERLLDTLPPRPPGYSKTREAFVGTTGAIFDELAPAAAAVTLTLEVLLDPHRVARLVRDDAPGFTDVVDRLLAESWGVQPAQRDAALQRQTNRLVLHALMRLAVNAEADAEVRAIALDAVESLDERLARSTSPDRATRAQHRLARFEIERMRRDPESIVLLPVVTPPPGSPIGMPFGMPSGTGAGYADHN